MEVDMEMERWCKGPTDFDTEEAWLDFWARGLEDESPEFIARAREEMRTIERVLAPDFVDLTITRVPWLFAMRLRNHATWAREWRTGFAEVLERIEGTEGLDTVRSRLLHRYNAHEALDVINTASELRRVGCTTAFDPVVLVGDRPKAPDVAATTPNGVRIICEVSRIGDSAEQRKARETADAVLGLGSNWRIGPGLRFTGTVFKILSKPRLDDVRQKLARACARARDNMCVVRVYVPGVVDFTIAHNDADVSDPDLPRLPAANGGWLDGPNPVDDWPRRVRMKIQKKVRQLPPDEPGVLVLDGRALDDDLPALVDAVEEQVFEYPQLVAAVLRAGLSGEPSTVGVRTLGAHRAIDRTRIYGGFERLVLLENRYASVTGATAALATTTKAFGIRR